MEQNNSIRRYRQVYARLLRFYSRPFYERFGEGMEQTFGDLLREREAGGRGVFGCALWMMMETSTGIIKEKAGVMRTRQRNIIRIAVIVALLLMVPLVAMLFTDEVDWGVGDFIAGGVLLFGAGLVYELVASRGGNRAYRLAVGVAVVSVLLLIWGNLAVGVIGNEDNPVNQLYDIVFVIGIIGAVVARLRPRGMARTMFAMAVAQALIPVAAYIIVRPPFSPLEAFTGVFRVTAFFVTLFVASALLFRQAGEKVTAQTPQPE